MTVASQVKTYMIDYQERNGMLDDKEYEELFVKTYLYYMNKDRSLTSPPKLNHKKNGLR